MKINAHVLLASFAAVWLNVGVHGDEDFQQLDGPARVALARERHGAAVRELCANASLAYPPTEIFLRAFKRPGELELWASDRGEPLRLLKTYAITGLGRAGAPGPKRREGDLQVPEGAYRIVVFNPQSSFHLSLGLDYPNESDRVRSDPLNPGGEIYIHGGSVSRGCLPVGDDSIEEIFLIAIDAKARGQHEIPVHIFPTRMSGADWSDLQRRHPEHAAFWSELQPLHDAFEKTRRVPRVEISTDGRYAILPEGDKR